eukprot:scaffold34652_cov211-Amphora_coffeaeformis.AAC.14
MSDFDIRQKEYGLTSFDQTREVLQNPDTIVIDIRRPDEIAAEGKVEHENFHQVTVTLDDASALEACAPTMLPNKDATVFFYCKSGRRATNATKTLKAMGYTNVLNGGGFADVMAALEGTKQTCQ